MHLCWKLFLVLYPSCLLNKKYFSKEKKIDWGLGTCRAPLLKSLGFVSVVPLQYNTFQEKKMGKNQFAGDWLLLPGLN